MLRRSCLSLLCSVGLIAQGPTSSNALKPTDTIGFTGVGPVRMGMTVKQLRKAIGIPISVEYDVSEECGYAAPEAISLEIAFMVLKNIVVRTDVSKPGFKTARGVQVGDTEKLVLKLYRGLVVITPHTYVDTGHYLTIKSKDGKYALVFETDNGVVTSFRVGLLPAAEYIEGCA